MTSETTEKPKAVKVVKPAKTQAAYIECIGRRKTAVARVRATPASKNTYIVNAMPIEDYFKVPELREIVTSPLATDGVVGKYAVTVLVSGSGSHSQAEAIRHGLSRILVKEDAELKKGLKKQGFLKRDSRKKERKHFGLKKARKASQWSKR